jgi:hypothetical protein
MLSEAHGGETMKNLSVSECHKGFKEGRDYVEVMKVAVIPDLTEPMKMLKSAESGAFR